jgi:hypothetical protein
MIDAARLKRVHARYLSSLVALCSRGGPTDVLSAAPLVEVEAHLRQHPVRQPSLLVVVPLTVAYARLLTCGAVAAPARPGPRRPRPRTGRPSTPGTGATAQGVGVRSRNSPAIRACAPASSTYRRATPTARARADTSARCAAAPTARLPGWARPRRLPCAISRQNARSTCCAGAGRPGEYNTGRTARPDSC